MNCRKPFKLLFSYKSAVIANILFIVAGILWVPSKYLQLTVIQFKGERNESHPNESTHHEQRKVVHFRRKRETMHIDCGKLLHDDKGDYSRKLTASRPKLSDHVYLSMSCEHIRARVLPPKPLNGMKFGVAHLRIVYESYEFLEDELRSSYHPQNIFCYSIDYKAKKEFTERVEALAKCLPNVIVPKERYVIGRRGINGTRAHYACMKAVMAYKGWGYAILMQNYDVMIKTVYETVSILGVLEGANDVHMGKCERKRYNQSLKWDVRSLRFYRNEKAMTPSQLNASLTFARGAVHASLSRAAVDWMVNTVDLTKTFEQLDLNVVGVDEVLIPTLQVSDSLNMPGRFTAQCVKNGRTIGFITRVAIWTGEDKLKCRSQQYRHSVCIFGVEDFVWLAKYPKLMANKMMPSIDYGVVDCMHELIFNRTHLGQTNYLWDLKEYEKQPYVKYHKYRQHPYPGFKLDCSYGMPN